MLKLPGDIMFKEIIGFLRGPLPTKISERQKRLDSLGIGTLPVRVQIDKVSNRVDRQGWRRIENLPCEISILTPPEKGYGVFRDDNAGETMYTAGHDCEDYIFHKNGIMAWLPDKLPEITDPKKGDIVFYFSEGKYGKSVNHVGKYDGDGHVISKWGEGGPVLKHPIHFVPTLYGDAVLFRRISEGQIEEFQKLPDPDWI
ncbi:MAG: hypothetical protein HW405_979 [Candidatus Berkelbacteria bacterium]|nr:hypothetical protein [Candidatus Berkelbacteria bacterium]